MCFKKIILPAITIAAAAGSEHDEEVSKVESNKEWTEVYHKYKMAESEAKMTYRTIFPKRKFGEFLKQCTLSRFRNIVAETLNPVITSLTKFSDAFQFCPNDYKAWSLP